MAAASSSDDAGPVSGEARKHVQVEVEDLLERGLPVREKHVDPLTKQTGTPQCAGHPMTQRPHMSAGVLVQVFQSDSVAPRDDEQVPRCHGFRSMKTTATSSSYHAGRGVTDHDRAEHTLLTANGRHGRIVSASTDKGHPF